ncbi:hypothetical protein [Sphaerisporangium album]|nr:hypothetical protein [Sphaerisporangium album]
MFATSDELVVLLTPRMARRMQASLRRLDVGAIYLEDGFPVG